MPTTLPKKVPEGYRRQSTGAANDSGLLAATIFVTLVFSFTTAVLSPELILPALGIIVVSSGLVLGAAALLMKRSGWQILSHKDDQTLDIAGALVLFGFAVAIVCDKSEALRLLSALPG